MLDSHSEYAVYSMMYNIQYNINSTCVYRMPIFAALHVCMPSMQFHKCLFLCVALSESNIIWEHHQCKKHSQKLVIHHIPEHVDFLLWFAISCNGCFLWRCPSITTEKAWKNHLLKTSCHLNSLSVESWLYFFLIVRRVTMVQVHNRGHDRG